MTYLQIVNAVLRRLRETEVESVSDTTYSKLVGDYINEAKREVEDSWDWIQLRNTIQVVTSAGTSEYTLTSAAQRFRILRDRTTNGWDVFNDTEDYQLYKAPSSAWMTRMFNTTPSTQQEPLWFDINGSTDGDPNVDLWPIPDAAYTINFNMVLPQADFALDGTDDSTVITVPDWVVVMGAYALAISERGEDGGMSYAEADDRFRLALSDAISKDAANVPEELRFEAE